jgi:hypothetical protein
MIFIFLEEQIKYSSLIIFIHLTNTLQYNTKIKLYILGPDYVRCTWYNNMW